MNTTVNQLYLGLDVGSTTVKAVVIESESHTMLFSRYQRHHSEQVRAILHLLKEVSESFPGQTFRTAICGSGGRPVSEITGIPFVQEVVANAAAVQAFYPEARTAIELGGQDAKIIFFREDQNTGKLVTSDMRMNGSCAGGTGAFIDEVASLLKTPVEEFESLAASGTTVHTISGRCGVFAKTDIQGILNAGANRADIALSSFHAIAKQSIGGLAQGLDLHPPIIFEGGPLTFNPTLVKVFAERLHLKETEIIRPKHPDTIVALGAALGAVELFPDTPAFSLPEIIFKLEKYLSRPKQITASTEEPYFQSDEEQKEWLNRHRMKEPSAPDLQPGETLSVYIGIDAGSTTSKFVLLDEEEQIIDSFYANNRGDPIRVVKEGLLRIHEKYTEKGIHLEVLGLGTTGYGELMLGKAFGADYHTVETVAHAAAAQKYVPDVSFLLDIGGQDMKAMWISDGIITNITLNEACSSGCGSFLETFAATLNIPVEKIADAAFRSGQPASLGSRCTVFMNSTIITEQKNGRSPEDIMAGLCRSVIKNVFTKVVRIPNPESLGTKIVVQGGTFKNNAVLRAIEQYIGREVTRAPYTGLMGAIGAALLTKRKAEESDLICPSHFIGWDQLPSFDYTQKDNLPCPFCSNHCSRTVIEFTGGERFITGNRCERGEILGDPKEAAVREQVKNTKRMQDTVPNLFRLRDKLLFRTYETPVLLPDQGITIGIPRVLSFWETMPFWSTFWHALGFRTVLSSRSTRSMYESGLHAVTSDTVCFPAKLVHGHLRDLAEKKVDRIFMPSITTVTSENTAPTSESMCAIVKGYPLVVRNSDNPDRVLGIPFDAPLFHWHLPKDRDRQLTLYMEKTFHIPPAVTRQAMAAGDAAQAQFAEELTDAGQKIIDDVTARGTYAIVLASRPYQNDKLVNHGLPDLFTELGIPVLTADSVPGIQNVDLSCSRLDIVNNFHARMLSSAITAAKNDHLEYVQFVSFGCGHDAYLSDEIIRMMREISGKNPLILKLDESDALGSLRIRIRSFTETIAMKRKLALPVSVHDLTDPYPEKFKKSDRADKLILVPNTSHAFSQMMAAVFARQGLKTASLPVGHEEAIRLGKQYVHNDICFPAQIVIGEALEALSSGKYDPSHVAIGMGKYIGDCRLTHYSALLRKALDDAGFPEVSIITNDDKDASNLHPGFRMSLLSGMNIAFSLPMIDALEELLRKIRPYELVPGSTEDAFNYGIGEICYGIRTGGVRGMRKGFKRAINRMCTVKYDRSELRPTVLIVGEYLLNFHPGANHDIEKYLEANGFEIIEARMTDVIRKSYYYLDTQIREYRLQKPAGEKLYFRSANEVFNFAHVMANSIAKKHPLYRPATRLQDLAKDSDPVIHHTFDAGEGILIPGEILHHAKHGCRSFIILQPFGCLPNHIVGRGITRRLKELYPEASILPLDYDPDVSFANIENRLQMLIMNEKTRQMQEHGTSNL